MERGEEENFDNLFLFKTKIHRGNIQKHTKKKKKTYQNLYMFESVHIFLDPFVKVLYYPCKFFRQLITSSKFVPRLEMYNQEVSKNFKIHRGNKVYKVWKGRSGSRITCYFFVNSRITWHVPNHVF